MGNIMDAMRRDEEHLSALYKAAWRYASGDVSSVVPTHVQGIIRSALYNGYTAYPAKKDGVPLLLQRRVRVGHATLYFITIEVRDFATALVSLEPGTQFHIGARHGPGARTVDVRVFVKDTDSLADIEDVFAKFYGAMGCVPYDD